MSNTLQIKRGTKAGLPTLAAGEPGWCTDTYELYVGDGATNRFIGSPTPVYNSIGVLQPTIGNEVLRLESVATNDDPNYIAVQARGVTTDATPTIIWTGATVTDTVGFYEAKVVARQTAGTGTGDGGAFERRCMVSNIGGSLSFSGDPVTMSLADSLFWGSITFDISGTDVVLKVTGAASMTITWHATIIKQTVGT